jgi:hypothetical protein
MLHAGTSREFGNRMQFTFLKLPLGQGPTVNFRTAVTL